MLGMHVYESRHAQTRFSTQGMCTLCCAHHVIWCVHCAVHSRLCDHVIWFVCAEVRIGLMCGWLTMQTVYHQLKPRSIARLALACAHVAMPSLLQQTVLFCSGPCKGWAGSLLLARGRCPAPPLLPPHAPHAQPEDWLRLPILRAGGYRQYAAARMC